MITAPRPGCAAGVSRLARLGCRSPPATPCRPTVTRCFRSLTR